MSRDIHVITRIPRAADEPEKIIVQNNRVILSQCQLYTTHFCAIVNVHHVCPESWWRAAGKDPSQSSFLTLCPNCHYNVHAAIDGIILKRITTKIPLKCRNLAKAAFDGAMTNGLTPALTL